MNNINNKMLEKNKIFMLVQNAMFVVVTLILGFFGRYLSIFPVFPYLKLDVSDVPAFISALLFGTSSGLTVLFISNLLRTLLFSSSSGWVGFIIRITSAIIVISLGQFCRGKTKISQKIFGISFGIIICVSIKMLLNYFFWLNFFSLSKKLIDSFLFTLIIPFNIIKPLATSLIAMALVKPVKKLWHRSSV